MIRFASLLVSGWALALPALACEAVNLDNAVCQRVVVLGAGDQAVCHWKFDFRAKAAEDRFVHVGQVLQGCFGNALPPQVGVNHPDSYTQKIFETGDGKVSVALKDKGGLAESYVFLRGPVSVVRPE